MACLALVAKSQGIQLRKFTRGSKGGLKSLTQSVERAIMIRPGMASIHLMPNLNGGEQKYLLAIFAQAGYMRFLNHFLQCMKDLTSAAYSIQKMSLWMRSLA